MVAPAGRRRDRQPRKFSAGLRRRLCEFAAAVERLRLPDEHGVSRGTRLLQFEQRTGKRHPDLDPPQPADETLYLLDWWRELDEARPAGVSGPQPLSFSELSSWAALTRRSPTADEVLTLRAIDRAYLAMCEEEAAKRRATKPKGPRK